MINKKNIKDFFKEYEMIVSTVTLLLFTIFLTFFILLPNFKRANQMFTNTKELKVRIERLERKDKTLSTLDKQYFQNNFTNINNILPSNKDFVLLFSTFDHLQQRTGVSVSRTDFQLGVVSTNSAFLKKADKSGAYKMPLTLEILGTIDQIRLFIVSLTDLSGRLITLDNIQMEIEVDGTVTAILNGDAYFYPLPKTIGGIDTELPELSRENENMLINIAKTQPSVSVVDSESMIPVGRGNLFY